MFIEQTTREKVFEVITMRWRNIMDKNFLDNTSRLILQWFDRSPRHSEWRLKLEKYRWLTTFRENFYNVSLEQLGSAKAGYSYKNTATSSSLVLGVQHGLKKIVAKASQDSFHIPFDRWWQKNLLSSKRVKQNVKLIELTDTKQTSIWGKAEKWNWTMFDPALTQGTRFFKSLKASDTTLCVWSEWLVGFLFDWNLFSLTGFRPTWLSSSSKKMFLISWLLNPSVVERSNSIFFLIMLRAMEKCPLVNRLVCNPIGVPVCDPVF